jgi:alkanesulfonate monooxygenase SsuD/methylene tetrahydromethanopterin reductase-like flavin-dependent oxidoreductase (luciferase family)
VDTDRNGSEQAWANAGAHSAVVQVLSYPAGMRLGFKTAPQRVDWPTLDAIWGLAGETDVFDSAWTFDHLYPVDGDGACFEGWTTLALLAHRVPDKQIGHLVLANPYRHPGLVAKMATTMDHATNGQFVLGLGAGWHEPETRAYGLRLDPVPVRLRELEAALRVIRALFGPDAAAWPAAGGQSSSEVGGATLDAPPYQLKHARNDPPPLTRGGPPIWLGTQGERVGMRLVATYADGWNFSGGTVPEFADKLEALDRACEAAGRDRKTVEVSVQRRVGPNPEERRAALEYGREVARQGCEHLVLYFDPRSGPEGLSILVDQVARPLRDEFGA